MKADLHLHTTASDGRLSPEEVVEKAHEIGLDIIAITDHDTVDGISPALQSASRYPGLTVIPGIEINTDVPRSEAHILGYFINDSDENLKHTLEELRSSRYERGRKMVTRLGELGIQIEWARVLDIADGGPVGRPHIAQALFEKGYVSSLRDAFDKYIGRNAIAYIERRKITPVKATELILKSGGIPALAHPAEIEQADTLVSQLKEAGLLGIEVYYARYLPETVQFLLRLARKYDLIPTGGSDFHGFDNSVGADIGSIGPPEDSIERLMNLAKEKRTVI